MTADEARQIAELINRRNELMRRYRPADVQESAANYEFESRDGAVVACVERKRVQWYQWEICHLSVAEDCERKGLASMVYARAEAAARLAGVSLLQCTIREGNGASESFFSRQGFHRVGTFLNTRSGNTVGVWQKVLSGPTSGSLGY
jgi:N-acetylglutamate synthase-like GNAT family acetyltransferase